MKSSRIPSKSIYRTFEEFFWNMVGGSMVVAMLAGVFYVLIALFASEMHGIDRFWETKYFIRLFVAFLAFYLILPSIFTAVLGAVIGSASGTKKRG